MITSIIAGLVLASAGQASESEKVDAIWSAATDRIIMQEDAWFDDGEFPMVVQLLEFHVDLDPTNYDVATNLGWMHENIEQWDEAHVVYRQFLADNPTYPDRALPEAEYLFRLKKYEEVISYAESTLGDKSHPNLFRILAHSYERTGRFADSKKVWDRYIALAPDDLPAQNNRKRVIGKLEEASKTK